jgi:hypothetical protein
VLLHIAGTINYVSGREERDEGTRKRDIAHDVKNHMCAAVVGVGAMNYGLKHEFKIGLSAAYMETHRLTVCHFPPFCPLTFCCLYHNSAKDEKRHLFAAKNLCLVYWKSKKRHLLP